MSQNVKPLQWMENIRKTEKEEKKSILKELLLFAQNL